MNANGCKSPPDAPLRVQELTTDVVRNHREHLIRVLAAMEESLRVLEDGLPPDSIFELCEVQGKGLDVYSRRVGGRHLAAMKRACREVTP